jgi:hypothetical protein
MGQRRRRLDAVWGCVLTYVASFLRSHLSERILRVQASLAIAECVWTVTFAKVTSVAVTLALKSWHVFRYRKYGRNGFAKDGCLRLKAARLIDRAALTLTNCSHNVELFMIP